MSFSIRVDHEACIGIGVCESMTPELFAVADGRAELVTETPQATLLASAHEAAAACPMAAIHVAEG